MSENRIQYKEACPECAAKAVENFLFLDMDTTVIQCQAGHVFEELPSDQVLRNGLQSASNPVLQTGENVEKLPAETAAPESAQANTLEESGAPDVLTKRLEDIGEELARQNQEIADKYNIDLASVPAVPEAPIPPMEGRAYPKELVGEGESIRLANGDLLLGVRIPETWKQAIEAEAEAQLKSPAAYFGEWLTSDEMKSAVVDLLQNYWSAAYTQKV